MVQVNRKKKHRTSQHGPPTKIQMMTLFDSKNQKKKIKLDPIETQCQQFFFLKKDNNLLNNFFHFGGMSTEEQLINLIC
jgi:hypothetical protein